MRIAEFSRRHIMSFLYCMSTAYTTAYTQCSVDPVRMLTYLYLCLTQDYHCCYPSLREMADGKECL